MSKPDLIALPLIPEIDFARVRKYIGLPIVDYQTYKDGIYDVESELLLDGLPTRIIDVSFKKLKAWTENNGYDPKDGTLLAAFVSDMQNITN